MDVLKYCHVASDIRDLFANRPVLRRALFPVLSFGAVAAATSLAFILLAGVHPVEAVFWLISPASIGLYFEETTGPERVVKTVAVMGRSGLVIAGLWIGQTVVAALFGGQITEELKRMQQEREIEKLENHTVVCGYGMFGRTVVRQLDGGTSDIVVIEQDPDIVVEAEREDHLVIDGDARQESVLKRAGADRAETVVAAVDDSNVNIQIAIVVRELAPNAELVVRIGEQEYAQLARRAGATSVVIPEVMSGENIAGEISRRSRQ
jgi:voltage-gated potassium channel